VNLFVVVNPYPFGSFALLWRMITRKMKSNKKQRLSVVVFFICYRRCHHNLTAGCSLPDHGSLLNFYCNSGTSFGVSLFDLTNGTILFFVLFLLNQIYGLAYICYLIINYCLNSEYIAMQPEERKHFL